MQPPPELLTEFYRVLPSFTEFFFFEWDFPFYLFIFCFAVVCWPLPCWSSAVAIQHPRRVDFFNGFRRNVFFWKCFFYHFHHFVFRRLGGSQSTPTATEGFRGFCSSIFIGSLWVWSLDRVKMGYTRLQ